MQTSLFPETIAAVVQRQQIIKKKLPAPDQKHILLNETTRSDSGSSGNTGKTYSPYPAPSLFNSMTKKKAYESRFFSLIIRYSILTIAAGTVFFASAAISGNTFIASDSDITSMVCDDDFL